MVGWDQVSLISTHLLGRCIIYEPSDDVVISVNLSRPSVLPYLVLSVA